MFSTDSAMVATSPGPEAAILYRKAAQYCASAEHCEQDVRLKLRNWGAGTSESDEIVSKLKAEGFIDQQRYALAFVRGKFRNNHWGKIKIHSELKNKGIDTNIIVMALENGLNTDENLSLLKKLLEKKMHQLGSQTREAQVKALRFVASKGFEPELARRILNEIIKNN